MAWTAVRVFCQTLHAVLLRVRCFAHTLFPHNYHTEYYWKLSYCYVPGNAIIDNNTGLRFLYNIKWFPDVGVCLHVDHSGSFTDMTFFRAPQAWSVERHGCGSPKNRRRFRSEFCCVLYIIYTWYLGTYYRGNADLLLLNIRAPTHLRVWGFQL